MLPIFYYVYLCSGNIIIIANQLHYYSELHAKSRP